MRNGRIGSKIITFWLQEEELLRTAVHEIGHTPASLLLDPETRRASVNVAGQALPLGRVEIERPGGNRTGGG